MPCSAWLVTSSSRRLDQEVPVAVAEQDAEPGGQRAIGGLSLQAMLDIGAVEMLGDTQGVDVRAAKHRCGPAGAAQRDREVLE